MAGRPSEIFEINSSQDIASQSKTYLLSIAIGDYYRNGFNDLPNAINDSEIIIECLTTNYKIDLFEKLHDADATCTNVELIFDKLNRHIRSEDSLLVFFNGHGDIKYNKGYWILSDGRLPYSELLKFIASINAKHILFFSNACHSGIINTEFSVGNFEALGSDTSRLFFASGREIEAVSDGEYGTNSPFVKAIVGFLNKEKEDNYNPVKFINLESYVRNWFDVNAKHSLSRPASFQLSNHKGGDFLFFKKYDDFEEWKKATDENSIESYTIYLEKFGIRAQNYDEANLRVEKLKKIRIEWNELIGLISKSINNFIKKFPDNNIFLTEAKYLTDKFETWKHDLDEELEIERDWGIIDNTDDIQKIILFIEKFKNSDKALRYVDQARKKINSLKKIEADKIQWDKIPLKKFRTIQGIESRLNALMAYTVEHPNGLRIKDAEKSIRDLKLFLESYRELEENKKIKKLEYYISTYKGEGECTNIAQKELEELKSKKYKEQQETELKEAIDSEDIGQIADIAENMDYIEEIRERARDWKDQYETKMKEDFNAAIESNKIKELVFFYKKYKKGELVNQAKSKFLEKDFECFKNAQIDDTIESYEYYLEEFESYDGASIDEAKKRIKEIELDNVAFNRANTKEELESYLETFENGKHRDTVLEKIKNIDRQEEKIALFEKIYTEE